MAGASKHSCARIVDHFSRRGAFIDMKLLSALGLLVALASCHGKDVILGAPEPVLYVEEPAACQREVKELAYIPGLDPRFLLADPTSLYVLSSDVSGVSIWKISKVALPTELASGLPPIDGIALSSAEGFDHGALLFTSEGALRSIPTAGGDITTLADGREDLGAVLAVNRSVYWSETERDPGGSKRGAIARIVLPDGLPQTVALTPDAIPPQRFTLWDEWLVWTTGAGDVVTLPLRFVLGPLTTIFHGASGILGTDDALFLGTGGAIVALHSDGTKDEFPTSIRVEDFAAYGSNLYFFDGSRFTTTTSTFAHETPLALASKGGPLAVDSRCLYFVDTDARAIKMVQR
jgi:hypothetical protein